MTDVLTNDSQPAKRPTFLTVLCILTFIGSGWGLISNCMGYFAASTTSAAMSQVKSMNMHSGTEEGKMAENLLNTMGISVFTEQNLKNNALANLAASVLCLIGAFLMWGLKKNGFYAYILGTLVGIIAPMALFGFGNILALGISIVIGFFGLAFCIMYGLNLKYMK